MLDKLKSLFIVEENDNKTKEKEQDKTEKKKVIKNLQDKPKQPTKVKGTLNEKIMTKLLTVLSDNNMEGFDYIEYKNAIKALETMQMDEKTKFRSAFATAQTIGLTLPKLLDSITYYQKVLNKENDSFLSALNNQINIKVGDKKKELQDYNKMIEDKSLQIKKLQAEISKHKEVQNTLKSKIEEDTISIEKTRGDFETTYYKLIHQINEDVEKIKKYLQ